MEKRNLIFLISFCNIIISITAVSQYNEGSGYIFTSPRTLKIGSNNQLQMLRFGNEDPGMVKVSLFYKQNYDSNETLVSENTFKLPQGQKQTFFELSVSHFKDDSVYGGRIQINGTIGGQKISGSDDVEFAAPKNNIIVLQTCKPLYKPGQDVNIRVLKINSQLKPSRNKKDVGEVYIEDPKGTRLFQQDKVYLGKGLTQLKKFWLADEPALGTWTVFLKNKNETESTTFDVKEYELPKFEVKIKFPSYTLATEQNIPIQVCANYTYGKPVAGQLNLNVSIQQYYYYYSSSSDRNPVDQQHFKINGCYIYNLNVTKIQKDPKNPNYYSDIQVVANVVEDGTGVQINATSNLERTTSPLNIDFNSEQNQRNYFKPGLPYNGKVKVSHPDGTPAAGETVQLSYTVNKQRVIAGYLGTRQVQYSKNFTTDEKGVIKYTIPPQNEDTTSISIQSQSFKYSGDSVLSNPSGSLYLNAFYSPSGSFLQLANVDGTIPCGTKKDFKLLFTLKKYEDIEIYYEVLRQGKVVSDGKQKVEFTEEDDVSHRFENDNRLINDKEQQLVPTPEQSSSSSSSFDSEEGCPAAKESRYLPHVGEAKISIDVDHSLSDSFTLLVFYVREDKETVADSQTFQVQKCFKNQVNFQFTDAVKQPGQETSVKITASPNSLCGVRAIDKSVTLLDKSNQLTTDKIFQLIDDMNVDNYYSNDLCYKDNPTQPGLATSDIILPPGPGYSSSSDDSYAIFQQSGLLVISNLHVFTRKCDNNGGGGGIFPPIFLDGPAPDGMVKRLILPKGAAAVVGPGITAVSAVEVRQNFPETWLFELELIGPTGMLSTKKTLPDTITEWLNDAVCVSKKDGLGISDTASIRGFQLFFISYTLPVSVIRGEEFTIVVSIFSYADAALPVTVSLDDPEGFEVDSKSINKDICIQPGTAQNFPLKLKATTVGKINITARAETSQNSDACGSSDVSNSYARDAITQSLDVEAEGFPVQTVESILFCPLDQGNNTFDETYELIVPNDAVNDSARAFVDVTGNILGPAIMNLDNLVSLPTGCGEQNLVKFVPNYLVLDYLSAIGELTDDIKAKAIQNLNTGYQRELTYRHDDGSFSAFGTNDPSGSMFLTAFVLRSFYEAKRYITIDDNIIKDAQQWIVKHQQEDGCFPNIGKIIDTGLQGGIEKDDSPLAITGYVTGSLLLSGYNESTFFNLSVTCGTNNPPQIPYEYFLAAFDEVLNGADALARTKFEHAKPFSQTREDGSMTYFNPNGTDAIDLETVAYAVLVHVQLKTKLNDILPLVRYLTQNLNPNGGFYSTQDTCVGLAALASFAKLVYGKPIDINVEISGGLDEYIQITEKNKILVQRNQVSQVPSQLRIKASGTGCGLVQVNFRYNSVSPPDQNKFYIKVAGICNGNKCDQRKISGTARYLPDGKVTGFSVITVKMISGIVPDRDSVKKLPGLNNNKILRADVEGNNVILYYNEITNRGEKFEFSVTKVVDVHNPQPGSATIVNYYNPSIASTTTYSFDDNSKKNEN